MSVHKVKIVMSSVEHKMCCFLQDVLLFPPSIIKSKIGNKKGYHRHHISNLPRTAGGRRSSSTGPRAGAVSSLADLWHMMR